MPLRPPVPASLIHRVMAGCLLSGTLLAMAAETSPVSTPFEVRTEAREWFEDVARRGSGPVDDAALLERAQQILARHGDRLVDDPAMPGTALPLAELVPRSLARAGLSARFVGVYDPSAGRRLSETADDAGLRLLARSYPGTAAARQAWQQLAQRQWDRGQLSSFLRSSGMSGIAAEAGPAQARVAAARTLLRPAVDQPPPSLDGIDQLWLQQLDLRTQGRPVRRGLRTVGIDSERPRARIALSAPLGDLMCASDGARAVVFDHLMGRLAAPSVPLGSGGLSRRQARPVVMRNGFVALGIEENQRIALTAIARDGSLLWRTVSPGVGFNPLLSPPVAIDHVVAVAAVVSDEDAAELRVLAYDQGSGRLVWDARVARLGATRAWMTVGDQGVSFPSLCRHGSGLMVLSNGGVMARIGAGGEVERVWTYRAGDDGGKVLGRPATGRRSGVVVSDGQVAVATPADLPDQTLILDGDADPSPYRGDGAGGEALAARDGTAWLAASRVVALDLASRHVRWDAPAPSAEGDLQAVVGDGELLVAGSEALVVLDQSDGRERSRRRLERPLGLGVGDHTVVLAGDGETGPYVAAFGAANDLVVRLAAAAERDPNDIKAVVALASLAEGRKRPDEALAWYEEAFRRGAHADIAAKAARLMRRSLEHASGEGWIPALARLAALSEREPAYAAELSYWHGRQAEAAKDPAAAVVAYARARDMAAPGALYEGADGISVHLALLAEAGLARCTPPVVAAAVAAPALSITAGWTHAGRRGGPTVRGGGMVVGYADGVLSAVRLEDGREVWWRPPARALLGVRSRPEQNPAGVAVDIMPGTSAAAAGLRSGDVLLRFNQREIRNFTADLVPAVLALTVRTPFVAEVLRDGQPLTIPGTLGGEMVEPVDANDRTVLVWPTAVGPVGTGIPMPPGPSGARPEGMWVAVHDLATGRELWRHGLPPITQTANPPRPLLTAGDLVIVADGADLVAYPAHGGANPDPAWRLPGIGSALAAASLLPDGRRLWLPDASGSVSRLIDARSGRSEAVFPVNAGQPPLVGDRDVLLRADDGTMWCADLGFARMRWHVTGISSLLAVRGDAVWVINAAKQLVCLDRYSGTVRRLYGEWHAIDEMVVEGDRMYLAARPTATSHALACISVAGGAILWQQALPQGIGGLAAGVDGIAGVLADGGDGLAVLAFTPDGTVRRALLDPSLGAPLQVSLLSGGVVLAAGSGGLRCCVDELPPVPPPLPCRKGEDPERLSWQDLGGARYAWSSLLAVRQLWIETARDGIEIRLAPLGALVVSDPLVLRFPADGLPVLGSGLVAEAAPAPAGRRRWRVRCPATLFGDALLPWQSDARVIGQPGDRLAAWLQRQWRTVVDLP